MMKYKKYTLAIKDSTTLENAIAEKFAEGWKGALKFGVAHFRSGMLLFGCIDPQTVR